MKRKRKRKRKIRKNKNIMEEDSNMTDTKNTKY